MRFTGAKGLYSILQLVKERTETETPLSRALERMCSVLIKMNIYLREGKGRKREKKKSMLLQPPLRTLQE